jgi:hypothetical protein
MLEPIELSYDLHLLPRGRVSFCRWRYELWHGQTLLSAGWRLSPLHAQRALQAHALRYAHRVHGLHPLHSDRLPDSGLALSGRVFALELGHVRVRLIPRASLDAA